MKSWISSDWCLFAFPRDIESKVIMNRFTAFAIAAVLSLSPLADSFGQRQKPKVLPYKTVDDRELKLEVINPKDWDATDKRPAVLFFHGGSWVSGKPQQFTSHGTHLAERGMVSLLVEYRLLDKRKADQKRKTLQSPEICIHDAKSAMRFVRSHAAELGVDPDRIAAGGGSAGGHLAAFLGTTDGIDDPNDDQEISARPNVMILFNPVYDNSPEGWGHNRTRERYKEFSPAHNISSDDAPSIVFLGTEDQLIPVATAEKFQSDMKAAGVDSELHLYEGAAHGFFNKQKYGGKFHRQTIEDLDKYLIELGWIE
jgi:acetyl esterase/lipase